MTFDGTSVQNAIYIQGECPWPVAAEEWESLAREKLDPGAFDYIAGGAGGESTMRANREAFERRRIRPRMLTGNTKRELGVEILGTHSPAPFLLAPVGVLSIAHPEGEVAVARAAAELGIPFTPLERGVVVDRGDRRGDGRRAALVPALLDQRPRDHREPPLARRGGRLLGGRRHARHADPRLAPARPAKGVPPVHQGRGLRAVLHRPRLPGEARQAARGGPADGRRDDARDVPAPPADVGRPRVAPRADLAADARQGRAHGRGRRARARRRRRGRDRLEPRRAAGGRRRRGARRARRGARGARRPTRRC